MRSFGGLQRRLDDAGDARCHFVLQVKHVLQRAAKTVCPEMRVSRRVDQLRGNAHASARSAHRAFEDIAHAQFAADLLYVDGLAFVRQARIAGDHEEPADTR